jgi:hypothetical protein
MIPKMKPEVHDIILCWHHDEPRINQFLVAEVITAPGEESPHWMNVEPIGMPGVVVSVRGAECKVLGTKASLKNSVFLVTTPGKVYACNPDQQPLSKLPKAARAYVQDVQLTKLL